MVSKHKLKYSLFALFVLMFLLLGLSFISGSEQIASSKAAIDNPQSSEIPQSLLPQIVETLGGANSQYHISEDKGSYTSRTPGHGIVTTFNNNQIVFERGQNAIGMRLISKHANITPKKVSDNRIEYQRGNITEWYVNSPYGMEQGFTVDNKPQGTENEVSLSIGLDLEDGVKAIDRKSGKSIQFIDSDENHILNYSGLYAFDSTGRELPSSLSLKENDIIQINVDDRNAQYPITIDPFVEAQRVTAADPTSGSGDDFAWSVSIDGDRAIVGIPAWDGAAGGGQGAVIIYERNGSGVWVATPTLFSPDPGSFDDFGTAVSISGDWALIGEPDADNGAANDGAAHFFERVGGTWTFRQTVFHTPGTEGESFGITVSISGDRAVVGDPDWEPSTATRNSGRIFVYERSGPTWVASPLNPIASGDSDRNDQFGFSVSISGDWLIVGAPGDSNNGTFSDFIEWGAIYFFQRVGGTWTEIQKVIGETDSELGSNVAIDGNIAIAGALAENVSGFGSNTGAVYLFERIGTDWTIGSATPDVVATETRIGASNPNATDRFGISVAIFGDIVVVGATGQDIGMPGDPGTISNPGSAYIYQRTAPGVWGNEQELFASDPSMSALFGQSVSISGDTIFVGSPQADEIGPPTVGEQGAGYFFDVGAMLTIEKESNPDGGTGFGFTGTGFSSTCGLDGSFTLDDNDSAGTSFIDCNVLPGSYTVQETDPNGHTIADINCAGTTNFTETADSVTVNLIEEDMVVCTFTNNRTRTLNVTVIGSGTVTSSPAGIDCGSDCTEDYITGTSVTLTPTPNPGFMFDRWNLTGDCSDGNVTMTGNRNCTARFVAIPMRTLTVTSSAGGTVTSSPAGIDCGSDCTEDYEQGTVVALTPTPDTGFVFDSWSGDADCSDGSVTMSVNTSCTATFIEEFTLTTSVTGSGTVTSSPAGIDCGSDCTEDYDIGTVVALTPTPDAGFVFDGWTGDADCSDGSVTMNAARTCTANFIVEQFTLDINLSPSGGGTVSATGIACPGDCTEDYDTGSSIALTPTPDAGFVFDGWTGAGCATGTVAMTQDRTCTANFIAEQFTLTTSVTGDGTISATGISCPGDCTEDYDIGTVVALTPTPGAGFVFDGWTGDADCSDGSVTMNAARTCTANFVVEQFTLNTSVTGDGTISATGISCPGDCTEDYDTGTVVALTPTPGAGFIFDGWTGDADCSDGSVTMNAARTCTANFVLQLFTLTIGVNGNGIVTAAGITCGADCLEDYSSGTIVSLTPIPDPGYAFDGWTGDGDCSDSNVTMSGNRSCTANFVEILFDLNINLAGTGVGNVSAPGIDCGDGGIDCAETYSSGTVVTLTPLENPTSVFSGFSGHPDCLDGIVTIDENKTCTASFDEEQSDPLVLNPISPALNNNINVISANGATPNKRVAFVWGYQPGFTTVSGPTCNGVELGIKNPRVLGIVKASAMQDAQFTFFLPQLGDVLSIWTQAIDITSCNNSQVVENIIRSL